MLAAISSPAKADLWSFLNPFSAAARDTLELENTAALLGLTPN
jgi:hypothetical protein